MAIRNDYLPDDPWQKNPSIESRLSNFIIYKNNRTGVLVEETGNLALVNFTVAENRDGGIEVY